MQRIIVFLKTFKQETEESVPDTADAKAYIPGNVAAVKQGGIVTEPEEPGILMGCLAGGPEKTMVSHMVEHATGMAAACGKRCKSGAVVSFRIHVYPMRIPDFLKLVCYVISL